MKKILSLPARIVECVSEYIFLISKNKQAKKAQKSKNTKKAKETKEERRIFPENRLKNKFMAARMKIFLVIRISENKTTFFLA